MTQEFPLRAGSGSGTAPAARVESRPASAGVRLAYLDNLKTLLIAGIIVMHSVNSYAEYGSWVYQDVREASLSPVAETLFVIVVSTGALFVMGLFFLISGLFTRDSLTRKGPERFVRDRLLRLGTPFAAYTLLIWPLLDYGVNEPFRHLGSYWWWFVHSDPMFDNGPMWFVGVLLIFSLGYVAWAWRFSRRSAPSGPLRGRHLVILALGIGAASFVVRLVFPMNTAQIFNLHLWEWPQCLTAFLLGAAAARRGWLRPLPDRLYRRCGVATLLAALTLPLMILSSEPLGLTEEMYFGGWHLPALLTAMVEGVLAVSAPLWALGFGERHLNRDNALRRKLARSSYAAFMVQGPVLVALALLLRPIGLPGDVKALAVSVLGLSGSFALAWLLVSRTRLGRIL
jgi:fucose 4-O-acetylase-like acetyltransferase